MANFAYKGRDSQGNATSGVVEAANEMAAAEQLMRLALQRQAHPVGKEADRRQCRDGDDHGGGQKTQFPGAGIPSEQAE